MRPNTLSMTQYPPLLLLLLLPLCMAPRDTHAETAIPVAKDYRAFGPLPTTTRGGDPLSSLPHAHLETLLALNTFPSETATGGYATWRKAVYNASAAGVITVPFADAELPYEAYALANFTVTVAANHPHVIKCDRSALIHANSLDEEYAHIIEENPTAADTHCPPDYYDDGRSLCVARLYPGHYSILVHLSSSSNETQFSCNFFFDPAQQPDMLLLPMNDTVAPSVVVEHTDDAMVARLAGAHLSITVMNIHDVTWTTSGSARLVDPPPGLRLAPQSSSDDHYPLPRIGPRQIRQLRLDLLVEASLLTETTRRQNATALPSAISVIIAVSYEFDQGVKYESEFNVSLSIASWRSSHSYHFTYVDVDGTVQAAAVLPPSKPCVNTSFGQDACTVLLSTHGAGVDAVASAWTDSYKTQTQSWVLLPTGRRKYGLNWEGPQMRSAITALYALADKLPGVPPGEADQWRVRKDVWLQAGHSMGGHGALLLATHFPDMLLAALPAMGWLRLSTYGESGETEDLSYSDASLRALLTVSSAEYSSDLYAENLLGIPFLARVGSDDDNVPPSNLRKFCRILKENEFFHNMSTTVSLSEVPGEGHWFDGVVDDDVLQPFINENLMKSRKPELPEKFTAFTMNPASSGSRGGLRILSLEVVFEISRLSVTRDAPSKGSWQIRTENIRRFRYEPVYGIEERPNHVYIDGDSNGFAIDAKALSESTGYVDFCAYPRREWTGTPPADTRNVIWKRCQEMRTYGKDKSLERGPDNFGPGFQVLARRKVAIVYPEGDTFLQGFAIRYANSLYLQGISAMVTTDSNVTVGQMKSRGDMNMVLLGGPNMNRMAKAQSDEGYAADVTFEGNRICIAHQKCYEEGGTGIAFLSGGAKRTLLFYVAGTDHDGLEAGLDFLPYSPSSHVPEWVIVKKAKGWGFRGLGGVVALGYWDAFWKVEPRKSYPAEFFFDVKRSGVTCATKSGQQAVYQTWGRGLAVALVVILAAVIFLLLRRRKGRYETVPVDEQPDDVAMTSSSKLSTEQAQVDQIGLLVQDKQ